VLQSNCRCRISNENVGMDDWIIMNCQLLRSAKENVRLPTNIDKVSREDTYNLLTFGLFNDTVLTS